MSVLLTQQKKRVKAALEGLPFGVGSRVVIPLIKWLLMIFYYQTRVINFRRKQFARNEAMSIDLALQNGVNEVMLVYDNLASPPTYGDYLYVILLGRYFIAQGVKLHFIIVDGEYRQDWNDLQDIQKQNFVIEQLKVAEVLLDSSLVKIERISWNSLQQRIASSLSAYLSFSINIKNRDPIYNHCFNVLNQLLRHKKASLLDDVLFSYDELSSKVKLVLPKKPYIAIGCRYSEKWGIERNLSDADFINCYLQLAKRFPDHNVMIISDTVGCRYFSDLAHKHAYDVITSKDYSQTFLGDGALILKSNFFFQLRGGGISTFAMFSKIPYKLIQPLENETMWSKSKFTSFQRTSQLFRNASQ